MVNMTGRKIIFILLSLLLISGAVVAVMTIDGGKWLISNPAFNQPPAESVQQNVVVPVTGAGFEVESVENQSPESGYGCHHDSAMNPADW